MALYKSRKLILILFLLVLIPAGFLGYTYFSVTREAASRIERGAIERIIASESPVYFDDARTPIGVFFDKIHRKYIPYNAIPKVFIKALIAAEDRRFFDHGGYDPRAILRAFVANLKAGRIVQGGSTLTQQTAKNIFKRERRSYRAKLKELIQAILFERRYSKEEILEFYSNQFFVTGFGKGLRIAAKYYFGKEAEDLDLVEAAFIAGSVKGPARYNPFLKKTEAEQEEARRLAKLRKDYVLRSMFQMGFIGREAYQEARERAVPFKEGQITYRLNVILDYVREQLESPYFLRVLRDQGIENIATSGIAVHTAVNQEIQEAALGSLRTHLPLMEIQLNGYSPENRVARAGMPLKGRLRESGNDLPFLARVTRISTNPQDTPLVVSWDQGGGLIDFQGLSAVGTAWVQWKKGRGAEFRRDQLPEFLDLFKPGDLVPVRWKSGRHHGPQKRLTLSMVPALEGGLVVLQKGMIRAMAGGFFNRFFNRAADAKRQLGSIFKPILYTAALQLKWNTLDPLPNMRSAYRFENTVYLPRPDHTPKSDRVSMAWAGAKSENLATVWLLYHLTDRLNLSEFRQIAERVGLGRRKGESYLAYKARIRDEHGVVVNRKAMLQAAFEEAKKGLEADIIFEGHGSMLEALGRLAFTTGRVPEPDSETEREILGLNYQRFQALGREARDRMERAARLFAVFKGLQTPETRRRLSEALRHVYRAGVPGETSRWVYTLNPAALSDMTLIPVTPEWILEKDVNPGNQDIWLENLITVRVLDQIRENMKGIYRQMLHRRRYEPEVLYRIRDFRTLVNLFYVVYLSKQMGISTELDPVLSFPLGPNAITILEAALAYQAMVTGLVHPLSPGMGLKQVPIMTRITDREGVTIWQYRPLARRVLSDRVSVLMAEILRKVMEIGTGQRARDAVRADLDMAGERVPLTIPTYGKTGTANRYTNSSFVGCVPAPDPSTGRLELDESYVIAGYVGYDDNRPMRGPHQAIYGASGALPLWIDTANAIVNSDAYRHRIPLADLAFDEDPARVITERHDLRAVPLHPGAGLPVEDSDPVEGRASLPRIQADVTEKAGVLKLNRHFEPLQGPAR